MPGAFGRRLLAAAAIFALAAALLAACRASASYSPTLLEIVGGPEGVFRGHELGRPLTAVRAAEARDPDLTDQAGLYYVYRLPDGARCEIEFYKFFSEEDSLLRGVVCNIFLEDELRTQALYQELNDYYARKFDRPPEGNFGRYRWENIGKNQTLYLDLLPGKTEITLNLAYQRQGGG